MDSIGKYTILEVIGRGGMGTVYRARDTVIGRDVAIKVIAEHVASIPNVKERFHQEAVSAGRLTHEHIMTIFDVGENEGRPFLVMELLDGRDLRSTFDSGDVLTFERKLEISLQICRALAYAHARGVVHRDIKPENVRILSTGRLKILDFGIARVESETRTMTHSSIGTPRYMSPEQVRGKEIDHRTDIFSFGVLLYELLSGVNPFDGNHVTAVIYKILHEEPEPVKVDDERLSADLQRIVARCLEKDADARYADFTSVIHDIEEVLSKRQSDSPTLLDDRGSYFAPEKRKPSSTSGDDTRMEASKGPSKPWAPAGEGRPMTPPPPTGAPAKRPSKRPAEQPTESPTASRNRSKTWAAVVAAVLVVTAVGGYFVLRSDLLTNGDPEPPLTTAVDGPVSDETAALYEEVVQLRNEMVVEKRNAEPWSESDALAPLYQEALDHENVAIAALQEKSDLSYRRAADAFQAAKNAFYAVFVAGQNDESALRDEVEAARQAMDQARQQIYDQRNSPLISDAFSRAEAAGRRGSEQFQNGDYTAALVAFGDAQSGFRDASRTLERATALEATRNRAESARQAMDATRAAVGAWRDAPGNAELYDEAETLRQEALSLVDAGRHEEAVTTFERADAAFAQIREPEEPDAPARTAETTEPAEPTTSGSATTAEEARVDMERSKAGVAEAHLQHERFQEATQLEQRAQSAVSDGAFDIAADFFRQAGEHYDAVAALPPPRTAEEAARDGLLPLLNLFEEGLEQEDSEQLRGLHPFLGAYSAMFDVADNISAEIDHSNLQVSSGRATVSVSLDLNYRNTTQRMREESQSVQLLWTLEEVEDGQWQLLEVSRQ